MEAHEIRDRQAAKAANDAPEQDLSIRLLDDRLHERALGHRRSGIEGDIQASVRMQPRETVTGNAIKTRKGAGADNAPIRQLAECVKRGARVRSASRVEAEIQRSSAGENGGSGRPELKEAGHP